jgi:lipoyl-dependent peroxiredoxin
MFVRKANAQWNGNLKEGNGTLSTESGVLKNTAYNFTSRFDQGEQTNPEELVGAAHSGCYSMALANIISGAGHKVNSIKTSDKVIFEKVDGGFKITKIEFETVGDVEGIDEAEFKKFAEEAKTGCPISKSLSNIEMILTAKLK